MPDMDLVSTTSCTPLSHRMTWVIAIMLFAFGSWLIGQGAWIHLKAVTAQYLLHHAWQQTLTSRQPAKPWPWADTWPVGRLLVPRLDIDQIILAGTSGQSLAFGPGKARNRQDLAHNSPNILLSGHRDTHFSFMRDIQHGDRLSMQSSQGKWLNFTVRSMEVMDSRIQTLHLNQDEVDLRLITCYPFDALSTGGPLRYVVQARRTQHLN